MHRLKSFRFPRMLAFSIILAFLFGGLVSQSVSAISNNPSPVCTGVKCTVTFNYTGDYYLWSPPAGASNITFDMVGAQGGRSGGLGGRVVGTLVSVPAALYVYVGGTGSQGSGATGGFNGGGNAGTGKGDEGSGGGATDIRTTTSLTDRIAVAAGGGGSGGMSGGVGGGAGGLSGSAGTSGQAQGGSGATQSAGGSGGYPNGGSWGATGTLGQGGTGGSSAVSGGGGGGGGYYGGGGGGADIDTCCTNSGGGGGGSSFASATLTTSVTHTSAYRIGTGRAIIGYTLPPSATTFSAGINETTGSTLSYSLIFNESVTGLASSDFDTGGSTTTCTTLDVAGSGTTYTISASGCGTGRFRLTLKAASVLGTLTGPLVNAAAPDVTLDQIPPSVLMSSPSSPTNLVSLKYPIVFSEIVTGLDVSDFMITPISCLPTLTGSGTTFELQLDSCADASTVSVSLNSNTVSDALGNLGPTAAAIANSVLIDRTRPTATVIVPQSPTASLQQTFDFNFSESVSGLSISDFEILGTNCEVNSLSGANANYTLQLKNCADESILQVTLLADSTQDGAGNSGPELALTAGAVTIDRIPPIPNWGSAMATGYDSPTFTLFFSEPITGLTASDFQQVGAASGCQLELIDTVPNLEFEIITSACSLGSVQLALQIGSYLDGLGNSGPLEVSTSGISTLIAKPVPTPTPTPTPTVEPSPTPTPEPSPEPTSSPTPTPEPTPSVSPTETPTPTPEPTSDNSAPTAYPDPAVTPAPEIVPIVGTMPIARSPLIEMSAEPQPSATEDTTEQTSADISATETGVQPQQVAEETWPSYFGYVIGIGSAGFASVGAFRGARVLRAKRMLRKFS